MAGELGSATLDLSTSDSGFARGVDRAEKKASGLSSTLQKARRAANQVGAAILKIGAAATVMGTVSLRAFAGFERGLVEVSKTANLTNQEAGNLGKRVQELSRELPIATQELLAIAAAAGQVGVKGVEDILIFTRTLGQLQLASDVVGEQGARSIARLLNITGEGTDTVDRLGSVITELGNNFAATESEIIRFSTFLGSATAQFNLSSKEVAALGASLAAAGQRAETSGSAVGAAMQEMNTALAEGGDTAKQLARLMGESVDDLRVSFGRDAVGAVLDFTKALGTLSAAEQTKVLKSLGLAGRETTRVINALVKTNEDARLAVESANKAYAENTALSIEAAKASATFSAQMRIFMNRLNVVLVNIGRRIAPTVIEATDQLGNFFDSIKDEDIENIKTLTEVLLDAAEGFVSLTRELARAGKGIGEFLSGPIDQKTKRFQDRLGLVNKEIEQLTSRLQRLKDAGSSDFEAIANLQNQINKRKELAKAIQVNTKSRTEAREALKLEGIASKTAISSISKIRELSTKQVEGQQTRLTSAVQRASGAAIKGLENLQEEGSTNAKFMADSFERAGDSISRSIGDAVVRGGNLLQSLGNIARNVAGEIISGFVRIGISKLLPGSGQLLGLATGGSINVGGNPGVDKNVLSINGSPIARVSRGERIDVTPQDQGSRQFHQEINIPLAFPPQLEAFVRNVAGPAGRDAALSVMRSQRGIA